MEVIDPCSCETVRSVCRWTFHSLKDWTQRTGQLIKFSLTYNLRCLQFHLFQENLLKSEYDVKFIQHDLE